MKRSRKKKKDPNKVVKIPRDKWTERIVYALLILIALLGIITGYMMSKQFSENELQEDGHFIEIEK